MGKPTAQIHEQVMQVYIKEGIDRTSVYMPYLQGIFQEQISHQHGYADPDNPFVHKALEHT